MRHCCLQLQASIPKHLQLLPKGASKGWKVDLLLLLLLL